MDGTFKKPAVRTYGKKTKFNKFGMLPEDSPVAVKKNSVTEQDEDGSEGSDDELEVEKVMKDLYGKKAHCPPPLEVENTAETTPVPLSKESHEAGAHFTSDGPPAADTTHHGEPSKTPETPQKPAATVVIANTQDTLDDITNEIGRAHV